MGVFSVGGTLLGTLLGVVLGLFGECWVRSWDEVLFEVADWKIIQGTPASPEEGQLEVRFLNGKDLNVVVWKMRVELYEREKRLEDWNTADYQFDAPLRTTSATRGAVCPPESLHRPSEALPAPALPLLFIHPTA